jgi:hypothetical protein
VGAAVSQFNVGDHVFGTTWFGAHAEFICLPESAALAHKPASMSFEEAAAVCDGAMQALDALRKADVQDGQRIVVYGASGSLGTAAIQLLGDPRRTWPDARGLGTGRSPTYRGLRICTVPNGSSERAMCRTHSGPPTGRR